MGGLKKCGPPQPDRLTEGRCSPQNTYKISHPFPNAGVKVDDPAFLARAILSFLYVQLCFHVFHRLVSLSD